MVKEDWCRSRLAFFVDKNNIIHVQAKNDNRYGHEWMEQDYGIVDWCKLIRGHITDREISFFTTENYAPVQTETIMCHIDTIFKEYKNNFADTSNVTVTSGKYKSDVDENWEPINVLGVVNEHNNVITID